MNPDDRRATIVTAALAVMQRRGIAATTVRDVAAQMGTSSGLVHHYFASMDDLVAAAFEEAASRDLAESLATLRGGQDPVEQLARFLDSYRRADQDGAMQLWLDAWAEAARRPALQRTSRRLNEEWQSHLAEVIGRGVALGLMTCDDPDGAAWRLLSLLDGLALQTVAHPSSITPEQAASWSRDQAERDLALPAGSLAPSRVPAGRQRGGRRPAPRRVSPAAGSV
jgi:AcrR family transcriptional regulator